MATQMFISIKIFQGKTGLFLQKTTDSLNQ